jgi:hypothetical protein
MKEVEIWIWDIEKNIKSGGQKTSSEYTILEDRGINEREILNRIYKNKMSECPRSSSGSG